MFKSRYKTLIVLIATLFGIYCFVFGQSGVLERFLLQREKGELDREIQALNLENERLYNLYNDYKNGKYLFEEAKSSGYVKPGSKVIYFRDETRENGALIKSQSDGLFDESDVEHFRILWFVVSVIIVGVYLYLSRNRREDE